MYNNVGPQLGMPRASEPGPFGNPFVGAGSGFIRGGLGAYGEKILGSSSEYVQSNGHWTRMSEPVGGRLSYKPPIYDINAPDLYIPFMAFGSYVVLAGLALGLHGKKATETLKQERTAMTTMEREAMVALKEIERIGVLVSRLETVERSIRATAKLAVKKRSSVEAAVGGMERERKRLKSTLVDLNKETVRCAGFAQLGRTLARDQIFQFLSQGDKISTK